MTTDHDFRSSIQRYLCPTKSSFVENFWWRHCMWFVVWAPPIKNPGYAYVLGHFIFRIFSSQCHNSLVFAARQIANNQSPMAKKFLFLVLVLRILSLERTSNNLACALQFFLCLFWCIFCGAQNRSFKPKFDLKRLYSWVIFAKKRKNFFCVFFWDPRPESQILTPHPCPPFKIFSLDALNSE